MKASQTTVKISVYSPTSYPVKFQEAQYSKSLSESVTIGTDTIRVQASGPAGITYSIVGGNPDTAFRVDSSTGQIQTNRELDYETVKSYKLAVRATCNTAPQMATDVIVTISVQDVNDNAPNFLLYTSPKTVIIDSYTPKDTIIFKVSIVIDRAVFLVLFCASKVACAPGGRIKCRREKIIEIAFAWYESLRAFSEGQTLPFMCCQPERQYSIAWY